MNPSSEQVKPRGRRHAPNTTALWHVTMVLMAGRQPEEAVRWPVCFQKWWVMTFLHWAYDPAQVRVVVPAELEVDT